MPVLTDGLSIINVLTDAAILVLPIKYVWNLHLNQTRRFFILGIFLLGSIVCVFGIIRCTAVGEANAIDPTWTNVKGGIWSAVELSVGIICACLPTFGPLFGRIMPGTRTNYVRHNANSYSGGRHTKKSSKFTSPGISLSPPAAPSSAWSKFDFGNEHRDDKPFATTHISNQGANASLQTWD